MKVIGISGNNWKPTYICEIDHTEIEKVCGKYYGKLEKLTTGDVMDLGAGHNFVVDIQAACKGITEGAEKFQAALANITKFSVMVASLPASEETTHESR